ncbi:hypothetical protein WP50_14145 [Lactiplantibacillus plantarum]|nr:hypothetical protein WP50_14145 [Lactiplantibacillus plantarum]
MKAHPATKIELTEDIASRNEQRVLEVTPLRLTTAGRTYYQYLTALENEKDYFNKQIRQYTHANQQVIRLGVLSSLGYYLLPLFLPAFKPVNLLFHKFQSWLVAENAVAYIAVTAGWSIWLHSSQQSQQIS